MLKLDYDMINGLRIGCHCGSANLTLLCIPLRAEAPDNAGGLGVLACQACKQNHDLTEALAILAKRYFHQPTQDLGGAA